MLIGDFFIFAVELFQCLSHVSDFHPNSSFWSIKETRRV